MQQDYSSKLEKLKGEAEDLLVQKCTMADKVIALIDYDKDLGEPLVFKDRNDATDFLINAASELGDENYIPYKQFFKAYLANAKRDLISGDLLEMDGMFYQNVKVRLDALKSFAKGAGLKAHELKNHLDRYILSLPKQLLFEIPEWDGVDRIHQLKDYITLKNHDWEIFELAFKEWGANVFRRLYDQEAQNRCIILKGAQGIGKDSILKSLLHAFRPYYAKFSSNRDERECWYQVTSRLILHIEEFDQTGQFSVAFLKDLISSHQATFRMPYEPAAQTKKCIGSFISTVNIDTILRDETGNRRFAVFEIEKIVWDYPKDNSPQVVAQFYHLYKNNFKAPKRVWDSVQDANSSYEAVDMGPELIEIWDERLKVIGQSQGGIKTLFNNAEVYHVVADLVRISGWRPRSIYSLLKTNKRSKHGRSGTKYSFSPIQD